MAIRPALPQTLGRQLDISIFSALKRSPALSLRGGACLLESSKKSCVWTLVVTRSRYNRLRASRLGALAIHRESFWWERALLLQRGNGSAWHRTSRTQPPQQRTILKRTNVSILTWRNQLESRAWLSRLLTQREERSFRFPTTVVLGTRRVYLQLVSESKRLRSLDQLNSWVPGSLAQSTCRSRGPA